MMTIPLFYFIIKFFNEVSYSKNTKIFRGNAEFIFTIGLQILLWGTYFSD